MSTTPAHMSVPEARAIASALLVEHGKSDWDVSFANLHRHAGVTDYHSRMIRLNSVLLGQRSYVDSMNTILHEIAHVLTQGHGHDRVWVAMFRALGGNGKRTFSHVDQSAPWVGVCEHGVEVAVRYRAPDKRTPDYVCRCVEGRSRIVWERRGENIQALRDAACTSCGLVHAGECF